MLRSMHFGSVMYMADICTRWDALMSFQEALEHRILPGDEGGDLGVYQVMFNIQTICQFID